MLLGWTSCSLVRLWRRGCWSLVQLCYSQVYVASMPSWQEKLVSPQRAHMAQFSLWALLLLWILTQMLKQQFSKSTPKSAAKRLHLFTCRNLSSCQPEDVPGGSVQVWQLRAWVWLLVTLKWWEAAFEGMGKCCFCSCISPGSSPGSFSGLFWSQYFCH